jgi:hypothetical protein
MNSVTCAQAEPTILAPPSGTTKLVALDTNNFFTRVDSDKDSSPVTFENFNAQLPSNAIITKVSVRLYECRTETTNLYLRFDNVDGRMNDVSAMLYSGSAALTTNQARMQALSTTLSTVDYVMFSSTDGSPVIAAAAANASDFGLQMIYHNGFYKEAYVDVYVKRVEIAFEYTVPGISAGAEY